MGALRSTRAHQRAEGGQRAGVGGRRRERREESGGNGEQRAAMMEEKERDRGQKAASACAGRQFWGLAVVWLNSVTEFLILLPSNNHTQALRWHSRDDASSRAVQQEREGISRAPSAEHARSAHHSSFFFMAFAPAPASFSHDVNATGVSVACYRAASVAHVTFTPCENRERCTASGTATTPALRSASGVIPQKHWHRRPPSSALSRSALCVCECSGP